MRDVLANLLWWFSLQINPRKQLAWNQWQYTSRPLLENSTNRRLHTELSANPALSRSLFERRHAEIAEHLRQHNSSANAYKVLNHLTVYWGEFVQSTETGKFHYYPTQWILEAAREPDKSRPLNDDFYPIKISRFAKFDY